MGCVQNQSRKLSKKPIPNPGVNAFEGINNSTSIVIPIASLIGELDGNNNLPNLRKDVGIIGNTELQGQSKGLTNTTSHKHPKSDQGLYPSWDTYQQQTPNRVNPVLRSSQQLPFFIGELNPNSDWPITLQGQNNETYQKPSSQIKQLPPLGEKKLYKSSFQNTQISSTLRDSDVKATPILRVLTQLPCQTSFEDQHKFQIPSVEIRLG